MDQSFSHWVANTIGAGAIVGAILGYLPAVSAIVALIYYLIQIYESETVQKRIAQRRTRKLARLKARVIVMEAQSKPPLPGPGD